MNYFAGIDGGGTKTHCVIGDADGNILSEGITSGSNYQSVGAMAAKREIEGALLQALKKLNCSKEDLAYTVLGLAGADTEQDYIALNKLCGEFLANGKYKVLNDTWIGLRAGIAENWGIVTICGTGGACSGRNSSGMEVTLRNLSYEAGNRGGGSDIIRMALHYAFRSDEKTGVKTRLEDELPKIFGCSAMNDLVDMVRSMTMKSEKAYEIPIVVCRLANERDAVCQEILMNIGHSLGEIAGGVSKRLEMENEKFRVTLVGSVFQSDNPLLIDEYTTTLHRAAPFAKIEIATQKPALGAYYLALNDLQKTVQNN